MADTPVVHIGENSPEEVALKLTRLVAVAEGIGLNTGSKSSRQWVLSTYAECLKVVNSGHYVP